MVRIGVGRCQICNVESPLISLKLRLCLSCICSKPEQSLQISNRIHEETRQVYGLPEKPPRSPIGVNCGQCANQCRIGIGERGYCGLVENVDGKLKRYGGTPERGVLQWYYDPLPTNCVSEWFCPGCTGAGYPEYTCNPGAEVGYKNLAVFYGSCSTDCLFCQNWHYRKMSVKRDSVVSAQQLAQKVDERTSCICFFGGDPSTQMPHALATCREATLEAREGRSLLRICWETNGRWNTRYAEAAAELSLESGGNIKCDLKTWNEALNIVLCGTSNTASLENFKRIGETYYHKRPELPVLSASTLLIPGYIDAAEVDQIAEFIADVDPSIPYTLLAFYPAYVLDDLPTTSRRQASDCRKAAKKHLSNVRIGNIHLLSS